MGILALVHHSLKAKLRSDLMTHEVFTIWIEIEREHEKNVIVGGIYRTWSDQQPLDLDIILSQIGRASSDNFPLLIMGDINLDTLRWSDPSLDKKLRDFANKWRSEISRTGLQPPTKKNGKVTALKSKAQLLSFAFKSGNLTILLCWWL